MKAPDLPEEKPSAPDKRDCIRIGAADSLADSIKSRLQAGEIIGALDFPECDRQLFWGAIAKVRDDLPCVRPSWRTISEQHLDGVRTRQKLFRIFPRQKGILDPTVAALVLIAAVATALLIGGPR